MTVAQTQLSILQRLLTVRVFNINNQLILRCNMKLLVQIFTLLRGILAAKKTVPIFISVSFIALAAKAGIPVIDGTNVVQTTISAVNNVQAVAKQIQQYQTQLQQYEKILPHLRHISGIRPIPLSTNYYRLKTRLAITRTRPGVWTHISNVIRTLTTINLLLVLIAILSVLQPRSTHCVVQSGIIQKRVKKRMMPFSK